MQLKAIPGLQRPQSASRSSWKITLVLFPCPWKWLLVASSCVQRSSAREGSGSQHPLLQNRWVAVGRGVKLDTPGLEQYDWSWNQTCSFWHVGSLNEIPPHQCRSAGVPCALCYIPQEKVPWPQGKSQQPQQKLHQQYCNGQGRLGADGGWIGPGKWQNQWQPCTLYPIPLPGPICQHKSTWSWAIYIGLSRPIVQAGSYPGAMPPYFKETLSFQLFP